MKVEYNIDTGRTKCTLKADDFIFPYVDYGVFKFTSNNKERKMKVKAEQGCHSSLTEGKVYEANEIALGYEVINDNGIKNYYHASHFTVVTEIEVGSEWVVPCVKGEVATVKYIGEHKVFIKWLDGSEGERNLNTFHDDFKPKTVTMWFYEYEGRISAYDKKPHSTAFNFICKKEIEL